MRVVNNYFTEKDCNRITEYYDAGVMKLKRRHERVVRTTISMPPFLFDYGHQLVKDDGFSTFSALVQNMLRERAKMETAKTQAVAI